MTEAKKTLENSEHQLSKDYENKYIREYIYSDWLDRIYIAGKSRKWDELNVLLDKFFNITLL